MNGYFGQMYATGMQKGEDSRFLQGIATLKHFDANSLEVSPPNFFLTSVSVNNFVGLFVWARVLGRAQNRCVLAACVLDTPSM